MTSISLTSFPLVVNSLNFQQQLSELSDRSSLVSSSIKLNKNKTNSSALHQSVLDGRLKQLIYFLKLGLKPDTKDKYGRTCLMLACLSDLEDYGLQVAKILLKNGSDPNQTDSLGRTALYLACTEKRVKLFNYILDNYSTVIDFRQKDNDGNILLNHISTYGTNQMLRKLIEKMIDKHIDIDIKNNFGYTGLLLAIKNDQFINAYYLIKDGNASTSIKDSEKCLNAIEWLMYRIQKNREKILNNNNNSKNSFQLTDNIQINSIKSLKKNNNLNLNANTKTWYNTPNQYHLHDLNCDHITSPNLSIEHHRSRYIPLILTNKGFNHDNKTKDISNYLKLNKSCENVYNDNKSSTSNSSMEDLDDNLSMKEVIEKLHELIYKKMSSSHKPTIQAMIQNELDKPKQMIKNKQRSMSIKVSDLKPLVDSKLSPLLAESSMSLNENKINKIDKNIFDLESMRQTPKLLALNKKNSSQTVKEVVHKIFDMYDRSYHRHESVCMRKNSNDMSIDLPKLTNNKSKYNLNNSHGSSNNNHIKSVKFRH